MMVKKKAIPLILTLIFTLHIRGALSLAYTHHRSKIRWLEYSEEAFKKARKENKPVYMLITAVWCYWCQVFEKKTLETEEVSGYLNKHYINIFVDYDRRKDIASRYPPTGLPTTVIFSPEGKELVSVPGFMDKERLLKSLKRTVELLRVEGGREGLEEEESSSPPSTGFVYPSDKDLKSLIDRMEEILRSNYDRVYGGFGLKEKQSYGDTLAFLVELYRATGDRRWLDMVERSLDYIGGLKTAGRRVRKVRGDYLLELYRNREGEDWIDRVGRLQIEDRLYSLHDLFEGGFFRYARSRDWSMPHFEKMLLENAEIIRAYTLTYESTGSRRYELLAIDGIDYVMKHLYSRKGFFYGSQLADDVYYHLMPDERRKVSPPPVDTTGYTVSNAKMVIALLEADRVFDAPGYREVAKEVLDFFGQKMLDSNGVFSYFDPEKGRGELDGLLIDNAWMALAYLKGYEVLKDKRYIEYAEDILNFMITELYDTSNGGFFDRRGADKGLYRAVENRSFKKPYVANGVAAYALIRAYETTRNEGYLYKARETIGAFLNEYPDASQPYMERAALLLLQIEAKNSAKGGVGYGEYRC